MKTIGLISANYISGNFGGLTDRRTLASIPYGGRYRLIDFALSNMVSAGISTVGVITPFNSGSLIDHVGKGKSWGLGRKVGGMFLMPGSVYGITMTGNRFLLRDMITNKQFLTKDDADYVLVTGSSDVFNMDYKPLIEYHQKGGNPVTVVYTSIPEGSGRRGFFLETDENNIVTEINTKKSGPTKYFMDCMVVDREFLIQTLDWYAALEYMDFMDVMSDNLDKIVIDAYEFNGYLGKVSSLEDYYKVSMEMLQSDVRKELFESDHLIATKVQDEAPIHYAPGCNVKNSIIAAGCVIEGTVENSIIFRSTHIAKDAVVKDSVVMMHGEIGEGAHIESVICDKYVKIGEGVKVAGSKEKPIVIGKEKEL